MENDENFSVEDEYCKTTKSKRSAIFHGFVDAHKYDNKGSSIEIEV